MTVRTQAVPEMLGTELSGSALRLRGVSRRFGGLVAVREVDLDLPHGARRALLGPNGAGKTTLFNLIAGDIQPSAGSITVFDVDVTHEPARYRVRRGVARTYQRSRLFAGLTVRQNLQLAYLGRTGPRYAMRLSPSAVLERDRLIESVAGHTGLTGDLDLSVGGLSHGRQRQLEIAMALAGQPSLLILDEPAAGLSPSERSLLTDLLLSLPPSLTILLIEHDMDVALKVADSVTLMHEGRIVVEGTPSEIRSSKLVHDLYLGTGDIDHE